MTPTSVSVNNDPEKICWNHNSGAAAINVAAHAGAKRIILLGFDMQLSKDGKANWHPNVLDKPDPDIYPKFLEGFKAVAKDLGLKYPGVGVVNITDDSKLDEFPKVGVQEFWKGRR